jgi:hypothetical protein
MMDPYKHAAQVREKLKASQDAGRRESGLLLLHSRENQASVRPSGVSALRPTANRRRLKGRRRFSNTESRAIPGQLGCDKRATRMLTTCPLQVALETGAMVAGAAGELEAAATDVEKQILTTLAQVIVLALDHECEALMSAKAKVKVEAKAWSSHTFSRLGPACRSEE